MPRPLPSAPRSRRSGLLLPPAAALFACGSGVLAIDPGIYVLPDAAADQCMPAVARIEQIDEPTPLGFSALDALERLAGPRSSPLVWLEPPESQEYLLTFGPERGSSTLTVDLRAQEGPILHRYRTPLLGAPEDTECDPGVLQIPVAVTLQSAAQGLAESFDGVLEARVPYRGHLTKSFEPGTLRGSLGLAHVASLDPERAFRLGPVTLEADVWEGGSAGSLSVYIAALHARDSEELRLPPTPAAQPGGVATWPSAEPCEGPARALPADAKVLGFSADDVLSSLRAEGPRRLTWSDGSVATVLLELARETPELCQEVGESLSFTVMLRARSEDGGLDVRLPVRVEAFDAGGRVGDIQVESAEPDAPFPLADGAGRVLDAEGYRSVLVEFAWTHSGDRDTGSLSLRGVDAKAPDASGAYASTALTNGRW